MIGDHTCLSASSCGLHWAWLAMLPRGHKTARTSQFSVKQVHEPMLLLRFIRNVISALHCVHTYSAGNGGFLSCQVGYLGIPTVLDFLYTVKS